MIVTSRVWQKLRLFFSEITLLRPQRDRRIYHSGAAGWVIAWVANYVNIKGDSKLHCVCSNLSAVLAAESQGEKSGVGETWSSSTVRKILLFIFKILFVSSVSVATLKTTT